MKEFVITHQLRILSVTAMITTIIAGMISKDAGGVLLSAFFMYYSFKYEN